MAFRFKAILLSIAVTASLAAAQTPDARAIDLGAAQRQTIFQSISKTQKNNAAPIGFRPAIGAQVPDGIPLEPLPDTLATLIPKTRGHEVAMVEKQVMLVEPQSKTVVAVVTGE